MALVRVLVFFTLRYAGIFIESVPDVQNIVFKQDLIYGIEFAKYALGPGGRL